MFNKEPNVNVRNVDYGGDGGECGDGSLGSSDPETTFLFRHPPLELWRLPAPPACQPCGGVTLAQAVGASCSGLRFPEEPKRLIWP